MGARLLSRVELMLWVQSITIISLEGVIVSYQAQKALDTYVLFFNGHNE